MLYYIQKYYLKFYSNTVVLMVNLLWAVIGIIIVQGFSHHISFQGFL